MGSKERSSHGNLFPQIIVEERQLCCHDSATLQQQSGEKDSQIIKQNFGSQPCSGKPLKIHGYRNR